MKKLFAKLFRKPAACDEIHNGRAVGKVVNYKGCSITFALMPAMEPGSSVMSVAALVEDLGLVTTSVPLPGHPCDKGMPKLDYTAFCKKHVDLMHLIIAMKYGDESIVIGKMLRTLRATDEEIMKTLNGSLQRVFFAKGVVIQPTTGYDVADINRAAQRFQRPTSGVVTAENPQAGQDAAPQNVAPPPVPPESAFKKTVH